MATKEGGLTAEAAEVLPEYGDLAAEGSGAAAAQVGRNGALGYGYAIQALPGRSGAMTPQLLLSYSSDGRESGWLSYGWALNLSSLERRGYRNHPIAPSASLDFDQDRYHLTLWGQGHELVHNPSHTDGIGTFRPRYDAPIWVKATADGHFDGWTVWSQGARYDFSSGAANTQYLTKITAPDQVNTLMMTYEAGGTYLISGVDYGKRAVYPSVIKYSCNSAGELCYTVRFFWENRPDVVLTATSGQLVAWTKRLHDIAIMTPKGEVAWRYVLTYTTDPHNHRSLLHAVDRQFGGKSDLPPVVFEYQEAMPPSEGKWQTVSAELEPLAYYGGWWEKYTQLGEKDYATKAYEIDGGVVFTDLNEDGLPDQVRRFRSDAPEAGSQQWAVNRMNLGGGKFELDASPELFAAYQSKGFWFVTSYNNTDNGFDPSTKIEGVQFGDVTGDGQLEILKSGAPPGAEGSNIISDGIHALDGTPLVNQAPAVPVAFWTADGPQGVRVLDVNGDGHADLVQGYAKAGQHQRRTWLYAPQSKTYVLDEAWAPLLDFHRDGTELSVWTLDVNADGLVDLLSTYTSEAGKKKYQDNVGLFLNTGQGWLNVGALWKVTHYEDLGLGTYFKQMPGGNWEQVEEDPEPTVKEYHLFDLLAENPRSSFADLNGDRLPDLVTYNYGHHIYYGAADAQFQQRKIGFENYQWDWAVWQLLALDQQAHVQLIDIDGDLLTDVVAASAGIAQFNHPAATQATIYLNPLPHPANLLTAVVHPLGARSAFQYTSYAQPGKRVGSPRLVVSRAQTTSDDTAAVFVTEYGYDDPEYFWKQDDFTKHPEYDEVRGPEFLGFRAVQRTEIGYEEGSHLHAADEENTDLTAVPEHSRRRASTFYAKGYAMLGRPQLQRLEASYDQGQSWQKISEDSLLYHDPNHLGVQLAPPFRPLLSDFIQQFYENGTATVRTAYEQHDSWGNPTRIMFQGRIGIESGDEQLTELQYNDADPAKGLVGQLLVSTVTHGGQWAKRQYSYDGKQRVSAVQMMASDVDGTATTSSTYDDYSSVLTMSQSGAAANAAPLVTTYQYDATYHQFPLAIKSPLGHTTKRLYHGLNAGSGTAQHFGRLARAYTPTSTALPMVAAYTDFTYNEFRRPKAMMTTETSTGKTLAKRSWEYVVDAAAGELTITTKRNYGFTPAEVRTAQNTVDSLGREFRAQTQTASGWLQMLREYGPYGTEKRVSAWHQAGAPPYWVEAGIDALGRRITIESAATQQSYSYQPFVVRVTDEAGLFKEVETDAFGRIIRSTDASAATTAMAYSHLTPGTPMVTMTGPDGAQTLLFQDGLGRTTKRVDPDRGTLTWSYDRLGNIVTATDAAGATSHRYYDVVGRLTGIDTKGDGSKDVSYFYDGVTASGQMKSAAALGQRTGMKDSSGTSTWTYDAVGRPQQVDRSIGSAANWYRMTMAYDQSGRLAEYQIVDPSSWLPKSFLTVRYRYDLDGLDKILYRRPQMPADLWISPLQDLHYDGNGRLTQVAYANATEEFRDYDATTGNLIAHRVIRTGKQSESLLEQGYTYYPHAQKLHTIQDQLNAQFTQTFTYGTRMQLTSASSPSYGDLQYTTTPSGNLETHGPWSLFYKDPTRPHAVTQAWNAETKQQLNFSYDANGQVTKAGNMAITYTDTLQMAKLSSPQGIVNFLYDGNDQRIRQSVTTWGTAQLADSGDPLLLAAIPPAQKPAKLPNFKKAPAVPKPGTKITDGPGTPKLVAKKFQQETITTPFPQWELIQRDDGSKEQRFHVWGLGRRLLTLTVDAAGKESTTYYYADHQGSTTLLADGITGTPLKNPDGTVQRLRYTPYGVPLQPNGKPDWSTWADPSTMYVGTPLSAITTAYVTGPRLYNPVLGRFYQPDPFPGTPQLQVTLNPYAYAGNNPVMAKDPTGLQIWISESSGGGSGGGGGGGGTPVTLYNSADNNGGGDEEWCGDFLCSQAPQSFNTPSPTVDYAGPRLDGPGSRPGHEGEVHSFAGESSEEAMAKYPPDQWRWLPEHEMMARYYALYEEFGLSKIARGVAPLEIAPDYSTELGLNVGGETIYYKDPTTKQLKFMKTILGEETSDILYHEFGHQLDNFGVVNRSGQIDRELVADAVAALLLFQDGMPFYSDKFYQSSETPLNNALRKCGGSLTDCGAFRDALIHGDADFFNTPPNFSYQFDHFLLEPFTQ